jgi:PAS domain-containing protein
MPQHPQDGVERRPARLGAAGVIDIDVLGGHAGVEERVDLYRYRTSSGEFRWMRWTAVSDSQGLYCVARDVTESHAAGVKLEQDASVMQAVLESVADGLCVADAQGLMTFINPAGAQLLGYESDAELLGRDPHATFHHTHADGVAYRIEDCPGEGPGHGRGCPNRRGRILA